MSLLKLRQIYIVYLKCICFTYSEFSIKENKPKVPHSNSPFNERQKKNLCEIKIDLIRLVVVALSIVLTNSMNLFVQFSLFHFTVHMTWLEYT